MTPRGGRGPKGGLPRRLAAFGLSPNFPPQFGHVFLQLCSFVWHCLQVFIDAARFGFTGRPSGPSGAPAASA